LTKVRTESIENEKKKMRKKQEETTEKNEVELRENRGKTKIKQRR
jgi:hypothetical protein